MKWTEGELAALKSAYASGTLRVSYDGKTIEYDSGDRLLARIRVLEAEIGTGTGGKKHPSAGFASFSRW